MIEDVLGKKKTAFDIFSMSIKYLKQEAEKLMLEKGQKVVKENISWIITVPAIWTDAAKQFMRQAAEEVDVLIRKSFIYHDYLLYIVNLNFSVIIILISYQTNSEK